MKITVRYARISVTTHASAEVIRYLDAAKRKEENLNHEKRRHWDKREFDEQILLRESSYPYCETPEQWYIRTRFLLFFRTIFQLHIAAL